MSRPNFVFIMTDTQGANAVGCYGRPEVGTPSIDRLAEEGVRFDRGYTTCPLCTPARAGIFTGVMPTVSGAYANNIAPADNIHTMGERFTDARYTSAYAGKWHLAGLDYFDSGVCPPGWLDEYWFDGRRYLAELTDEEVALWRHGLRTLADLERHDVRAEFTWAHRVADRAIRFLEERPDGPFLLVASFDEPHGPSVCPPEYVRPFTGFRYPVGPGARDDLVDKPAHQRDWAESADCTNPEGFLTKPRYFGCNSFVDAEIGRVLDAVDRLAPENTWVIYTSDHGDMMTAHRLSGKGPAMYEEITHIPFIVRPPAPARAGSVVARPVSHLDLLPTMLDAAGLKIPPFLQGRSLVADIEGGGDPERPVFIEFMRFAINHDNWGGFQPIRCVVQGSLKLVVNLLYTDELYDLETDPAENVNLIDDADYAERRDRLHDALIDRMNERRDPMRGPAWERRPWRKAPLRLAWQGERRPRPADGYLPPVLNYSTGRPFTDRAPGQ
jgi:uncharacterized sulfatase